MKLLRNEALEIVAFRELVSMSIEEREDILIDVYSDEDKYLEIKDYTSPDLNSDIIDYLKEDFKGYVSSYLESQVSSIFGVSVTVIGEVGTLLKCPCCGYKTIESEKQYLICKVCYWEEDGTREDNQYSSVNHMTLKEAKVNYRSIGAVSEMFEEEVDKEASMKYAK